jgi:hypothetical protein
VACDTRKLTTGTTSSLQRKVLNSTKVTAFKEHDIGSEYSIIASGQSWLPQLTTTWNKRRGQSVVGSRYHNYVISYQSLGAGFHCRSSATAG